MRGTSEQRRESSVERGCGSWVNTGDSFEIFFFSSRRRHTRSVSAFLLNRSSDLGIPAEPLVAEGRKANDSHADCYQYFCVPEYGTANGRLHFHAVHFMRTLPTGSVDPNFGRRVRNRRQDRKSVV